MVAGVAPSVELGPRPTCPIRLSCPDLPLRSAHHHHPAGGPNWRWRPSKAIQRLARTFVDCGASIVFGHSSHHIKARHRGRGLRTSASARHLQAASIARLRGQAACGGTTPLPALRMQLHAMLRSSLPLCCVTHEAVVCL